MNHIADNENWDLEFRGGVWGQLLNGTNGPSVRQETEEILSKHNLRRYMPLHTWAPKSLRLDRGQIGK